MSTFLTSAEALAHLERLATGDAPNCVNLDTIKDVRSRVKDPVANHQSQQERELDNRIRKSFTVYGVQPGE